MEEGTLGRCIRAEVALSAAPGRVWQVMHTDEVKLVETYLLFLQVAGESFDDRQAFWAVLPFPKERRG